MSTDIILFIVAAILFLLASFPRISIPQVNLVPAGLLFFTLATLVMAGAL